MASNEVSISIKQSRYEYDSIEKMFVLAALFLGNEEKFQQNKMLTNIIS